MTHILAPRCPDPECTFDGGHVPLDLGRNRVEDWWEWCCPNCGGRWDIDLSDDDYLHDLKAETT